MLVERKRYDSRVQPRELGLSEDPATLRGTSRLALSVRIGFRVLETPGERRPWEASIVAYRYTLEDRAGQEILSYHWHPEGRSDVSVPHLHLGPGATEGRVLADLAAAHLPTGYISLQAVLRLAIAELGVRPLQ